VAKIKKYNSKKEYRTTDKDVFVTPSNNSYIDDEICPINISNTNGEYIEISVEQASDLCKILSEIITESDSEIKVGDCVHIVSGAFSGVNGTVYDIDKVATKNELTIQVPKSENNDELYLYIDIADVEIISTKD